MSMNELQRFFETWDWETQQTVKVLKSLPEGQYDFRPDPKGRSLGEMAWHLAEGDAYMTWGIDQNGFGMQTKPPGIERPKTIAELAPGFERIHRDAVARIQKLKPEDLDRTIPFFRDEPMPIRTILWSTVIHHGIHHRAQLMLLARQAGGVVPGIYGPNREEMLKMMEEMKAKG